MRLRSRASLGLRSWAWLGPITTDPQAWAEILHARSMASYLLGSLESGLMCKPLLLCQLLNPKINPVSVSTMFRAVFESSLSPATFWQACRARSSPRKSPPRLAKDCTSLSRVCWMPPNLALGSCAWGSGSKLLGFRVEILF